MTSIRLHWLENARYLAHVTLKKINGNWVGNDINDLVTYFSTDPNEYVVHQVVTAHCTHCAGQVFILETDESSTCVRRTCAQCDQTTYMLDSQEHWPTTEEEAEASYFVECTCGSDQFETAVGFTFYELPPVARTPEVRSLSGV